MTRTALGTSSTVMGVEPIGSPSVWTGCGCRTASMVIHSRIVKVRRAVCPCHDPRGERK